MLHSIDMVLALHKFELLSSELGLALSVVLVRVLPLAPFLILPLRTLLAQIHNPPKPLANVPHPNDALSHAVARREEDPVGDELNARRRDVSVYRVGQR